MDAAPDGGAGDGLAVFLADFFAEAFFLVAMFVPLSEGFVA
jgi:hypothetical protein